MPAPITGFGLLGHLNEMVAASDPVTVELWIDETLSKALQHCSAGIASTLALPTAGPGQTRQPDTCDESWP